jgi:GxxExxY protein
MAPDPDTRDSQTYAIIGAAMAVHTELGCGFLESVYRASLTVELESRRIPHRVEVPFPIVYKGQPLALTYRADLVCFDEVVVEVKALGRVGPVEQAQAINYLKASRLGRCLILNFGTRSLEWRRVVLASGGAASL